MFAPDLATARWRKSSRSTNTNCVEVAVLDADWRKSSRSTDQANCVEVALAGLAVAMRDSKNPTGPALVFPPTTFRDFLDALKTGTFDPA